MNGFNPLHFNVGFVAAETVGYVRDIPIAVESYDWPDLKLTHLHGLVTFDRVSKGITARVQLQADMTIECMRCLEPYEQPLEVDFTELFSFLGKMPGAEFVFPESGQIDLGPLVREYMILAIPMQTVCRPDCQGLCPVCGGNLNQQVCRHEADEIDPRLAALRQLLTDEDA
ncbi:MAG: hypothetical protein Fur0018_23140 [Anaerolineales bacterium]